MSSRTSGASEVVGAVSLAHATGAKRGTGYSPTPGTASPSASCAPCLSSTGRPLGATSATALRRRGCYGMTQRTSYDPQGGAARQPCPPPIGGSQENIVVGV